MKKSTILWAVLSALCLPVCGQVMCESDFGDYSRYVDKAMGIHWKMPRGFIDLKQGNIPWGPDTRDSGGKLGIGYEAALQSKDGDCLILYPNMDIMLFAVQEKNDRLAQTMLESEMNAAYGLSATSGNIIEGASEADRQKNVATLYDTEVCELLRADTIFVADIPLQKPFREKYLHCTGLYVVKAGCPPMMLKCFFTEARKAKENAYLSWLYRSMKYQKSTWTYDDEKVTKERYKLMMKRKK